MHGAGTKQEVTIVSNGVSTWCHNFKATDKFDFNDPVEWRSAHLR